jgi:hypothetical protein
MKKILLSIALASVCSSSSLHAVTINLAGIANTTNNIGLITNSTRTATFSGRAIFVSVTNQLTGVSTSLDALLTTTSTSSATFDSTLASLIASTNPTLASTTNPGIVRSVNFTNGVLSTTGNQEMGSIGNRTYMFLVAESGGFVQALGAFTGVNVTSPGTVTFNSSFAGDSLGVGTSVFAAATAGPPATVASGFQLVSAIPETSTSLLGAIGALALLRRRRN